jgi:hypothetical protein
LQEILDAIPSAACTQPNGELGSTRGGAYGAEGHSAQCRQRNGAHVAATVHTDGTRLPNQLAFKVNGAIACLCSRYHEGRRQRCERDDTVCARHKLPRKVKTSLIEMLGEPFTASL